METQLSQASAEQNIQDQNHKASQGQGRAGSAIIIVFMAIAFSGAVVGFVIGLLFG